MLKNSGLLNNYELVKDWPQLTAGYAAGTPVGIDTDSSQHLFVFTRAGRQWTELVPIPQTFISGKTILEIDAVSGRLINSWGDHFFRMPHGLTVDANDNIWVTDVGLQQVFKFSHAGKLLMTLGQAGVAGKDATHFNMPTAVAIAEDGSIYVTDGYGNSRVVKYDAKGKYLLEWGRNGTGSGEFDTPHGIALDHKNHVYVADRENRRIQVFDSNGNFVKILSDEGFGNICSVVYDRQRHRLIAVDDLTSLDIMHKGSDIIVFDSALTSFTRIGRSGNYKGPVCWYHDAAVDKHGNIYVEDIIGNQLQKFMMK